MPSRYRFKGRAIGAAGYVEHPFHEFIEVQAASALPDIGGHGSARVERFRYREILHFDLAYTEVTGTVHPGKDGRPAYDTLVRAKIEHLDIMGMVTADKVIANLIATHDGSLGGEPSIRFTGTRFENLRIAGVPVKVDLCLDVFDRLHTYRHVRDAYKNDKEFRKLHDEITLKKRLKDAPQPVRDSFPDPPKNDAELPDINGVSRLTLVRRLEPEHPSVTCWGNVIHLEGFGTIQLAEFDICKHTRELTMIRVKLGCPVVATADVGSVADGGTPY